MAGMNLDLSNLPDDARLSKHDIASLIGLVEQKYQEKIHYLEERIRILQNELFGRKSEKRYPEDHLQLPIFQATQADESIDDEQGQDTIVIAEHNRIKRGRKPLPEDLPRVEIIHDLAEEEKVCPCGATLCRIGEDTCEKLDYVPAKVRVLRHIRYKYACKSCEGVEDDGPTVKIAPAPAALIPKSNATEGLLAHIVVSKFADGLPLYRQEKIFSRIGVDLPRATMANWLMQVARCCSPLIGLLQNEIRIGPLINMDESPLQVLKEPGRANTTKSYMWVFCGGDPEHPTVLFEYHPSRSGEVALKFLDEYQGHIQSDDYSGYDYLGKKKAIVHLGCWAHVRRKFFDVVKVRKKNRGKGDNPKGLADLALEYIGELYRIEKQIRLDQLTPEQIYQRRQEQSKPILDQFKEWLDATEPLTPPKGLLGIAIKYALKNWDKLIVYISNGLLQPDNNVAENAIRPFVVGRKNWLFAGHPNGASASATFFSLIETAKANGLEPYAYLRCLFGQLPFVKDQAGYRALLPQYIDPDLINRSNQI
jgi:transposase